MCDRWPRYPFIASTLILACVLYGMMITILLPTADLSVDHFKNLVTTQPRPLHTSGDCGCLLDPTPE